MIPRGSLWAHWLTVNIKFSLILESLQGPLDCVLAKLVCSYPFLRTICDTITWDAIFEMKFTSIFGSRANERLCWHFGMSFSFIIPKIQVCSWPSEHPMNRVGESEYAKTDTRPFRFFITSSKSHSWISSGSFTYPDAFCVWTRITMGCWEIVGSERRRFSSILESSRASALLLSTKQAIPS